MAAYDYRCRVCDSVFTVQRSITEIQQGLRCPDGHDDVARLWSAVSVTGTATAPRPSGGCCGGGCCA